jgi:hypothetical protein
MKLFIRLPEDHKPLKMAIQQVSGLFGDIDHVDMLVNADDEEADIAITDSPSSAQRMMNETENTVIVVIGTRREDRITAESLEERCNGRIRSFHVVQFVTSLAGLIGELEKEEG